MFETLCQLGWICFGNVLAPALQTYALWCIWSFCEELRVGIHAPALEDLVIGQDKVFLWNPQEPLKQSMRSAQYGAVPVGGEHPIFGSEHETNYPPPRMY
ncbi:unnamed protein product [Durusdinium trenchii]|uniref:Uncharacterized protein n=1 Tax=Durusdinium trenchii TaxID=1381693 RepID=A0ABP0RC03_9DINO